MKKIFILGMVVILSLSVLVGCGKKEVIDWDDLSVKDATEKVGEKERFEVEEVDEHEGKYIITLKKKPSSSKTAKTTMMMNTKDLLEKIYSKTEKGINLEWQVELTDKMGNTSYEPVIRLDFEQNTLEDINWEGFNYDNFPDIADYYWQHSIVEN